MRVPVWMVLVGCSALGILSTGLYVPGLPLLTRLFASDPATVQLTVSMNMLALSLAQLVLGPAADRYGRRRVLLFGLAGFALASAAGALALSIESLLAARIAQGACAGAAAVLAAVIIRELYDGAQATRIMALFGMVIGLMPALGPILGGYIVVLAGWRTVFVIVAGLGAAMLWAVWRAVPETGVGDPQALRAKAVLLRYGALLSAPPVLAYLLPLIGVFGALYAFVTAGPFVLIEQLGVATEHYGPIVAIPLIPFMAGSFAVSRLAGRIGTPLLVRGASLTAAAGGLLLAGFVLSGLGTVSALIVAMGVLQAGLGALLPAAYIGLLDAAPATARGSASALAGAGQMGGAALAGVLVGAFHDGTAVPMALTVAGLASFAAIAWLSLEARTR